ncbi:hypothetical protein NFC81_13560 [Salinispirillum sp. LH 10-3-1]|uniref:Uncharacterized protein n=1 Tax=Salinispirillum sp. LH 10-3-1 TaxID=2952525 RepID=A0AB38YER2_9GAMM
MLTEERFTPCKAGFFARKIAVQKPSIIRLFYVHMRVFLLGCFQALRVFLAAELKTVRKSKAWRDGLLVYTHAPKISEQDSAHARFSRDDFGEDRKNINKIRGL